MSELSELIEINKNIEKQNEEIIRLLKIIAGEQSSSSLLDEYVVIEQPMEVPDNIGPIDSALDVGEVLLVDGVDVFKFTYKNNEISIDNLTGNGEISDFNLAKIVANESIMNNISIDDGTAILTEQCQGKLPSALKVCVEGEFRKVFIPFRLMVELLGAPYDLQTVIEMDYYKSEENLIERLFKMGD